MNIKKDAHLYKSSHFLQEKNDVAIYLGMGKKKIEAAMDLSTPLTATTTTTCGGRGVGRRVGWLR